MIIDFHTHSFPRAIAQKAMEHLSDNGHVAYFTEACTDVLIGAMRENGVDYAVNLPVMTNPDQVVRVNDRQLRHKEELLSSGVICFGGLHPEFSGYKEEIARLKSHGIKGIKLHPAFQGRHINDISYKRILSAISEEGMIALVHCGFDPGFPGVNYAAVPEILEVIDEVQPQKMVLAHMGGWQTWDEVENELAGAPVWMDTAYSLGPVIPKRGHEDLVQYHFNLSQEAFVRLARKHGTDRVLFATDCPWALHRTYIEFIQNAPLTDEEKAAILGGNGAHLLGL